MVGGGVGVEKKKKKKCEKVFRSISNPLEGVSPLFVYKYPSLVGCKFKPRKTNDPLPVHCSI